MIKLVIAIKRNQAISSEQFRTHFSKQHAQLARECSASEKYVRGYVQSYTIDRQHSNHNGAKTNFDGLTELWFDSFEDMDCFFADPDYQAMLQPDEPRFADLANCAFFVTEEARII